MTTIGNVSSVSTVPRALRNLAEKVNDLSGADPHAHHVSEFDVRNALARQAMAKLRGKRGPLPDLEGDLGLLRRYVRRPGRGVQGGDAPSRGREVVATLAQLPLTDRPVDVMLLEARGKKLLWHGSPDAQGQLRIRTDERSGKTVRVLIQIDGHTFHDQLTVLGPAMRLTPDWSGTGQHTLSMLGQDWKIPASGPAGDAETLVTRAAAVTGLTKAEARDALQSTGAFEHIDFALRGLRFIEANAPRLPLEVRRAYVGAALKAWLAQSEPRAGYRALLIALQYKHEPVQTTPDALFIPWPRKEVDPISGGFGRDLNSATELGTGRSPKTQADIDGLLRKHDDAIEAGTRNRSSEARRNLIDALRKVARDPSLFHVMDHYFETGGTLFATGGGGRYDPDVPDNKMSVGSLESPRDTELTLVHEMLHYVFDRADFALGEVRDSGGGDHPVIHALVTRYALHSALARGENPLDKHFGVGTAEVAPDSHQALRAAGDAIARNDVAALREALTADLGEDLATRWSIQPTEWKLSRVDTYPFTPAQEAGLTQLYRPSAQILVRSLELAAKIAEETRTPLSKVFANSAYREQIGKILAAPPLHDGAQEHT